MTKATTNPIKSGPQITITRMPKVLAHGIVWGEFMIDGELREISVTWRDNPGEDADENPGGLIEALQELGIAEEVRFRIYYPPYSNYFTRVIQWLHTTETVYGDEKHYRELKQEDFYTRFVLPNWPEIVAYFVQKNYSGISPVAPTVEEFLRYYKHEEWKV